MTNYFSKNIIKEQKLGMVGEPDMWSFENLVVATNDLLIIISYCFIQTENEQNIKIKFDKNYVTKYRTVHPNRSYKTYFHRKIVLNPNPSKAS